LREQEQRARDDECDAAQALRPLPRQRRREPRRQQQHHELRLQGEARELHHRAAAEG
jgi:hypothetical protein